MKQTLSTVSLLLTVIFSLLACQAPETDQPAPVAESNSDEVQITIVVEGLLNPVGVEPLPDGGLLIAEEGTGEPDNSAGVTLLQADGQSGRLISGLPSGRDSGDLSGVPFAKWTPEKILLSHFNRGSLLTLPLTPNRPLTLPDTPYSAADLGEEMMPANAVQLQNPFDLVIDENGRPIVTDASGNGVATTNDAGETVFFHRFDTLSNPGEGKPQIEAVPTGLTQVGAEFFVTLTSGCPYPAGGGQLVAIDRSRNQRTILDGLNMPIDVVQSSDDTIWVLEFARFDPDGSCFSGGGYLPHTGRLGRIGRDGQFTPVLTELNFPGSIAFDANDNLFVSEIFSGRVLKVTGVPSITEALSVPDLLGETPAVEQTAADVPVFFANVAIEKGLIFEHGAFVASLSADPAAMMGAGLCWIDYNNDGWLDLYLINSHALEETDTWENNGGLPHNRLYQNEEGQFIDVSQSTGSDLALRGNGCVAADLNLDGWTDLYITADGPNALLWNQGDGTFLEGAAAAGVDAPEWNSAASVGDLNGDGWPDLFVAAYIDLENMIENPVGAFPQDFFGLPDRLYVNQGDGTFAEVTSAAGLNREERGLGSLMSDFDLDGDLDLYIANDGHPNRLYVNESNGSALRFTDISLTSNTNDSGSGMGVAGGDYDNNGLFDLLVTNWDTELNALYRNQYDQGGELEFRYSTFQIGMTGLGNNMTGWGTAWADFDHDGDEDLFVVNGHVPIGDLAADAQLVRLYGNRYVEGFPGQLREWTQDVGLSEEGVGRLLARGSAVADFDNDGDLDAAINTIGGQAALLENQNNTGRWFGVHFARPIPGTRAVIELPDGTKMIREVRFGSSYLASEDPRLHFGLGEVDQIARLTIFYPDGSVEEFEDLPSDQYLLLP
ncbi:MAG: ScyD/ScyE family protein [Ardenticatenaceae bacterium]|nr:ScyD/ScyE family protein [Ardenticatenaceae bacterium]